MIVIDGHSDLLNDVYKRRKNGETRVIETHYLERFRQGGINAFILSIFLTNEQVPDALKTALEYLAFLHEEIRESAGALSLCRNGHELERAISEGKIGFMVSFEGAEPILSLDLLRVFHELGVRGIGLTWSRANQAGEGSSYTPGVETNGLTEFGRELLNEAARLGMYVDISHLSDEGIADVFEQWGGIVIASHSNTRHLIDIKRNISDDQMREIARRGGTVGLNGASSQICADHREADYGRLLDHCDHMIEVMGEDHVGLGFDLCDEIFGASGEEWTRNSFDVVRDFTRYPDFIEAMRLRGYPEAKIEKITGGNLLNVLKRLP